jgi:tRNA isopentenyl-2-thiomethyl-A-37 hydroxylase MiaE
MEELIKFYNEKLERKQRLIQEYIKEKNTIEGFQNLKREIEYNILKAEIELIEKFIDNLNIL